MARKPRMLRVTTAEYQGFLNRIQPGDLFTTQGAGLVSKWIAAGQRRWLGGTGRNSHAGIVRAGQRRGEVIEAHFPHGVQKGHLRTYFEVGRFGRPMTTAVRLWRLDAMMRQGLKAEDFVRAAGLADRMLADGIDYDTLSIVTFGRLTNRRKMVCSEVVRRYLRELMRNVREFDPEENFLTPDEIEGYCELVAEL